MLIGIDASRSVSAERTGTENYSLFLIRALIGRGPQHRFRLYFNQRPRDGLFPQNERVAWRVIPFPRLWTHIRLAWEVMASPPDVLFVPAHVLPLVHPARCVATVHDLGYIRYPQLHTASAGRYLDWGTRFSARTAARVVVDSNATRDDLIEFYGTSPSKIVVAYPAGAEGLAPVKEPARLAEVRERYGTGERYFLYVGTLQPRKNLETLIRAYAELLARGDLPRDVRLVLGGRPGWKSEGILQLARRDDLQGRLILPGYVPQEDLAALLSGALAFVLPSWSEGFGLPLLEAMACGVPIICSNVASLPEVVDDAALLFHPGDGDALACAMRQLAHDEALRHDLTRRGTARLSAFSWEKCADKVLSALEAVGTDGATGR
jgi:glycosyltransferase involved in cell wall biosynthesis